MSEAFSRLHDNFRALKERHGVDLTVPHGVEIDGRVYPATHKLITLGRSRDLSPHYESHFYIPLENGLKVRASTYSGGRLGMQMHVPTIHIDESGKKTYRHGPSYNIGEDAYYASFGKNINDEHMLLHSTKGPISVAHEVLNMWAKEPYQGTYDWHNQQGYNHFKNIKPRHAYLQQDLRELTPDELNEHRQNIKAHPADAPHNVTVYGVDTDRAFYNYNTKTEQLRPYQDVFGTSSNES